MECWSGKARPEHGQETGQRARYGGAGKHRRITLTRVVQKPSMLSSSHLKIHDRPSRRVVTADRPQPARARTAKHERARHAHRRLEHAHQRRVLQRARRRLLDQRNPDRTKQRALDQLKKLGYDVTLTPVQTAAAG
jgi:hypothetical protein